MKRLFSWVVILLFLGGSIYVLLPRFTPCLQPIPYSIASVDSRFSVSREDFAADVRQAALLWSGAEGKTLFVPVETGGLVISAVYDARQETRDRLRDLGIRLDQGKQSFQSVKAQYDVQLKKYQDALTAYDREKSQYEAQKSAYNEQSAGGASADSLEQERIALNAFADRLNTTVDALHTQSNRVDGLVSVLNQIAADENVSIGQAKEISSAAGEEYEAGFYQQEGFSRSITLYSFQSHDELVRLIAHELGHALGMPHVEDPAAIMYRLNDTGSVVLTQSDRAALQKACSLWPPQFLSPQAGQ